MLIVHVNCTCQCATGHYVIAKLLVLWYEIDTASTQHRHIEPNRSWWHRYNCVAHDDLIFGDRRHRHQCSVGGDIAGRVQLPQVGVSHLDQRLHVLQLPVCIAWSVYRRSISRCAIGGTVTHERV
jgi:hypothetical protein